MTILGSYGTGRMLAALNSGDLGIILLILALAALGLAVWRAVLRDVIGTVLLLVVGVVLLLVAL